MNTVNRFIITLLTAVAMVGCGDVDPATWNDVAAGVPADGEVYMVVPDSVADSDLCRILLGDEEFYKVLDTALGLCSTRPDRVAGFDRKSRFVFTWPVSNPDELAKATEEWREAELHGDKEGRVKVIDDNSIVVSETQVWVVNSRDGVGTVNESLKAAAERSAASVTVLRDLVAGNDVATNVLYRTANSEDSVRFVSVYPTFVPRGLTADIEIKNPDGGIVPFVDNAMPLDVEAVRTAVNDRAFAAFQMPEGFASKALKLIAGFTGDTSTRILVAAVRPIIERAGGSLVVAVAGDGKVEARLPFVTSGDADKAFVDIGTIMRRVGVRVDMAVDGEAIVFRGTVDLKSAGIEVGPTAAAAAAGDEPLIGLVGCHIANDEYSIDFEAKATDRRARINILAPSDEVFRDMIKDFLSK